MNEMSKKASRTEPVEASKTRGITVAMRHGRGRAGGSTFLDLLVQWGRAEGRSVLVGDGDRRNPTLAGLYPPGTDGGATQPASDETPDVKQWLTDSIEEALGMQSSIVIDLGGGDRVMQEYGHDLALVDFCEAQGAQALGLFFSGPEVDDFEHVLAIWRAGYFRPRRSVLVFNEYLVPQGRTPHGAFARIMEQPGYGEMIDGGMRPMFLPRLPCMEEMRTAGLSFLDAVAGVSGTSGKPFGPVRQFMVKQWMDKIRGEFARIKATEWLP
ncbi:hypothetical protein RQ734_22610 [Roseomonas mucosa]|uniref:hypothetical protein n=1 Tax=Roseomonas mucosa TaxID=207340 RepID=UPI0028CE84E8|nr:hypothetical protein [Roseomonas mucosa]MDT8278847.1 hypothetical protein [Roseomonas mucosa]